MGPDIWHEEGGGCRSVRGGVMTVQSGAVLGGFGDVFGAVTNRSGSRLEPGHGAIGTLMLGSRTQETGAVNAFEVGGRGRAIWWPWPAT